MSSNVCGKQGWGYFTCGVDISGRRGTKQAVETIFVLLETTSHAASSVHFSIPCVTTTSGIAASNASVQPGIDIASAGNDGSDVVQSEIVKVNQRQRSLISFKLPRQRTETLDLSIETNSRQGTDNFIGPVKNGSRSANVQRQGISSALIAKDSKESFMVGLLGMLANVGLEGQEISGDEAD